VNGYKNKARKMEMAGKKLSPDNGGGNHYTAEEWP
jgi:hypothetical protein